jgi:hypothetical protein
MQKRDKLETMLRKITDNEFNAVWKDSYGYIPEGERSDLVRDFVAQRYEGELNGDIERAESFLHPAPRLKRNKWLSPR